MLITLVLSIICRIKEAAHSIYTDIKNDTQFLLNENLEKIKNLDIDIDLQSLFIILPAYDQLSK
jgi:hypothetical protein